MPVTRALSIALLAVTLVGAQIAGLAHRIEHAPGLGEHSASWYALPQHEHGGHDQSHDDHAHDAHDQDGDQAPEHNCAAYDAATLGDGPPIAQSDPAAASRPRPILTVHVSAVADNSPHLPFQSRAPPRA